MNKPEYIKSLAMDTVSGVSGGGSDDKETADDGDKKTDSNGIVVPTGWSIKKLLLPQSNKYLI